jgi:TPP-dependent 2-oxoacid decarboxylase
MLHYRYQKVFLSHFFREVHEEVNQAREKTSTLKQRRQEQEVARREKLRQAYLKKQLDKLLASKQATATDTGSSAG